MGEKLIVMDMDGTLLTDNKEVTTYTLEKLMSVQDQGVTLALASGRPITRLKDYTELLRFNEKGGFIIEGNGVAYFDYFKGSHHEVRRCSHEEAQEIIDYISPLNVEILIMGEVDAYIILAKGQSESYWIKTTTVENLKNRDIIYIDSIDEIKERLNKVCVCGIPEVIEKVSMHLKGLNKKYWYGRIMQHWIEIQPKEISKGNALSMIMKQYGYTKEDVLVFGDGENDISMLTVGKGIAMSNALDSVKKVCYAICDSNEEEGIANYLTQIGYK